MTSKQYEELCRILLAAKLQTSIDKVLSLDLESPTRPKLPAYAHQIDLYWEIEDNLVKLVNIADAKWHDHGNRVQMEAVLLLQQVRQQVRAHHAVLITNTDFADGARAAALHLGIALHIVRPVFNPRKLHATDPVVIRRQLRQIVMQTGPRSLYVHQGVGLGGLAPGLQDPAAERLPPRTPGGGGRHSRGRRSPAG